MGMAGSLSSRFGVRRLALGVAVVAAMLVAGSPATPTNHVPGPAPAASAPPPLDELGRGTPQGTLRGFLDAAALRNDRDRKSTRLNSSHLVISYAVFCLKKKTNKI